LKRVSHNTRWFFCAHRYYKAKKETVGKEEAESIKKQLEEAGASAELK